MKTATATSAGNRKSPPPPPPEEAGVRCPRCDSANTKFCYYNNYSLTQPRHFCKTCRRYWTKGGAIRNVPIGGGCRKNKKLKPSSSDVIGGASLKFFEGLSPAMDFQIAGVSLPPPLPRLHHHNHPFAYNPAATPSWFAPDAAGNNYGPVLGGAIQETMNNNDNNVNIASSIETLSFMNQDLHWKLQQQRLALLFGNGGGGDKEHNNIISTENYSDVALIPLDQRHQKLLEPTPAVSGGHGWLFGNSYVNQTTAGGGGNEIGQVTTVSSWNNGFEAWSHD